MWVIGAWLAQALVQAAMQVGADTSATIEVGDPVVVAVRVHLPGGATLVDGVPRTRDTLPDGVRVLSADTLRQDGGDWVGRVRVAFFRTDSQALPAFAVAYQTGGSTDTVVSRPIAIVVQAVLPAGNATLRDIREIETPLVPWRGMLISIVAVALAALWWRWQRQGVSTSVGNGVGHSVGARSPPGPLEVALAELTAIEQAGWDAGRQAVAAADVVRAYLETARGVPALERTTPEVRRLVVGNGALGALLADADRVKFARGTADAAFIERARALLRELAA
jgi:hypothetical protein